MTRVRDLPLGDKLVLVGVAASALALVVSSIIVLFSTYFGLRATVRNELRLQSAIVAESAADALAVREAAMAAEALAALRLSGDVDAACLFDDGGQLFARYVMPGSSAACPEALLPDGDVRSGGLEIVTPVMAGGTQVGTLHLEGSFGGLWHRMADQGVAALAGIGLGVVGAVVLSRRVQRIITEPIVELSSTAARISRAGDYSLRASKRGSDEIGQLVDAFNSMVSEIERRDDQLRGASRLKDEFLAALSHELRTPLSAVLGWIQVLRTTPADPITTARAHESIERNARAQASLIEDLLDISRIVSGKLHFKAEPVDLVGVIEGALEVVRPAAGAKGVMVARRLPPAPQIAIGDPHRLQQIAWNLLSNAVKFTSKGGRVDVELRVDGDEYVFEVRDNGIGIAAEFLPHVFDRFRQADGSITRRHGGLGLGLAIARELVELHGGRIRVASAGENHGATFTVVLPRPAEGTHPLPAPGGVRASRLENLALLVVDDDQDARNLATVVLSAAGASVQAVTSADEALRALAARRFDVLLLDLAMPGVDGYDLMRLIRENEHMGHHATPAIAVSAHAGPAVEERARASGFDGFVPKPYNLDSLHVAIRQAMRRRTAEAST